MLLQRDFNLDQLAVPTRCTDGRTGVAVFVAEVLVDESVHVVPAVMEILVCAKTKDVLITPAAGVSQW